MAKGKRPDGEGTLFWSEERQCWRGRLPAGEDGRRPWFSGRTQAEALENKRKLEKKREQGLDPTAQVPTVEQYGATWQAFIDRRKRPTTADGYGQMRRLYINPHLGKIRLDRLRPTRVQQWVDELADEGYSPSTIRNAYQRLRGMLRLAVRDGLLVQSPCREIELPPITRENIASLTEADARALQAAADGVLNKRPASKHHPKQPIPHRLACLIAVWLGLGLRKGEGLGLKWTDIDFKAATVRIRRQVQTVKGKTVIKEYAKTDDGHRTLPIPAPLLARLKAHRAAQAEERAVAEGEWKEHGLIFPTSNGTPVDPSNAWRMVQRLLERAGAPAVRVHDLRRTCASLLAQRGVQEQVIGAILGHAKGSVTALYIDVTLEQMRDALEGLSAALEKAA
jgi:integrase